MSTSRDGMTARAGHLLVGAQGETAAAEYLERLGWRILERNWRPAGRERGFELDLVARCADEVIFVEVKTRTRPAAAFAAAGAGLSACSDPGIPVAAALTRQKKGRLLRAAHHYLTACNCWQTPCRFDLVCVEQAPDGGLKLEHFSNVIEFGNALDSRHSAWQPW